MNTYDAFLAARDAVLEAHAVYKESRGPERESARRKYVALLAEYDAAYAALIVLN
jgi:hypothetical protein